MRKWQGFAGLGSLALLAAGCNQGAGPANVTTGDANFSSNQSEAINSAAAGSGGEVAPVAVAPVPVPAAGLPAPEAAPLRQAAAAASEIQSAADVERIPYDGGWAWRRNGQILRTASRDGRVSYFRAGESKPYLVQEGGRAYAYSNGNVQRGYDAQGRAVQLDNARRDESQRLAQQSAEERDQAKQVAARQPQRVERGQPKAGGDKAGQGHGGPASAQPHNGRADTPPAAGRDDRSATQAGDRQRTDARGGDQQNRGPQNRARNGHDDKE